MLWGDEDVEVSGEPNFPTSDVLLLISSLNRAGIPFLNTISSGWTYHLVLASIATMATQVAAPPSKRDELDTLTLDQILSDLDALAPNHALLSLANTSRNGPSQAGPSRTSTLLTSFESGAFASTNDQSPQLRRKDYVALSHELLASFRNAQRLNTEQVSSAEVGLLLPSERNHASSSKGSRAGKEEGKARSTRTDLLHAKVADLQIQVDAWDEALQGAVGMADEPGRSVSAPAMAAERIDGRTNDVVTAESEEEEEGGRSSTTHVESADPTSYAPASEDPALPSSIAPTMTTNTHHATSEASLAENERESASKAHAAATQDQFEDDDPWNDLS